MPSSVRAAFAAGCVALLVGLVYRPVLHLALMSDDYQWLQHARAAVRSPRLLLADLDTFYRPASTLTLALDHLVWGESAPGHRATNLLLHIAAALALLAAARRLAVGLVPATLVAAIWACAPFSFEPAAAVAIRFQSLLLLAWLLLIVIWPRPDETWTPRAILGATLITVLAMASKETWVVTPGLVVLLERFVHRRPLMATARTAFGFALGSLLYVAIYFSAFPSGKGYYSSSLAVLAKLPQMLAAFFYLEPLQPTPSTPTLASVFAATVVAGLALLAWRIRSDAGLIGIGLMILPVLPTLLVPFQPTRYTAIPYAGFLLLVVGTGSTLARDHVRRRRIAYVGLGVLSLGIPAGISAVRAEIRDLTRLSTHYQRLLDEASAVAEEFPIAVAVALLRGESNNLLERSSAHEGLDKALFIRNSGPYGLVDGPALFDWVLARRGLHVVDAAPTPGRFLVHLDGHFEWVLVEPAQWHARIDELRRHGVPFRLISAVPHR